MINGPFLAVESYLRQRMHVPLPTPPPFVPRLCFCQITPDMNGNFGALSSVPTSWRTGIYSGPLHIVPRS
jgi:hypothetical protein